ncbi:hypothetical protein [Methylomagnum sp.]
MDDFSPKCVNGLIDLAEIVGDYLEDATERYNRDCLERMPP